MPLHHYRAIARVRVVAAGVAALAAALAGCGEDRSGVPATNVADHRVAQVAATATVPGVCAPKPAKPATGGTAPAPMPAQPGSCAK